jgi:3-phytase
VPSGNPPFAVNGIVEILPLNPESLIVMERSFSTGTGGTGNTIKLYSVKLSGATDVNGVADLDEIKKGKFRPVKKQLLLDLDTLGLPLDNIEGMTFGPDLPDGRRSLILVSDNNFAAAQFTQFLLFAFD